MSGCLTPFSRLPQSEYLKQYDRECQTDNGAVIVGTSIKAEVYHWYHITVSLTCILSQ